MKTLILILMIVCLAGCNAEIPPEKETHISEISSEENSSSEEISSVLEENIFASEEELAVFFAENPALCGNIADENGGICLWIPANLPEKYSAFSARLSGSYVTYTVKNPDDPEDFFSLEWAFMATDGKKLLENSLNFSTEEISERAGYYYSAAFSYETGSEIGKKVLWTEENTFLSAVMNEELFEKLKNGMDFAEKITYN